MSWKLFWQIVLLIVIAVFISSTLRCGLKQLKCGSGYKKHPQYKQEMHKK